jgi:hypothetical protein
MRVSISVAVIIILGLYSVYASVVIAQQAEQINFLNSELSALTSRYSSLLSNYLSTQVALNQSYYAYNQLLKNYDTTRIVYVSPATNRSIPIWTIQQQVKPRGLIYWALLDTFINHIEIRANQTVQLVIVDLSNYANLVTGKAYVAVYNSTGTHFAFDQHFSQGCAVYVLVILNHSDSMVAIQPNVSATYAPTPFLTGQCVLP